MNSLLACETNISRRFKEANRDRVWTHAEYGIIAMPREPLSEHLNKMQREAVMIALTKRAMCISGAAGTGKTTIIKEIVRQMKLAGLTVWMCAPTGKAAVRMDEAVGNTKADQCAATIHRMLCWNPQECQWEMNEDNPVPADMVICDESSMVDVDLMTTLMKAVDPKRTTLILVGDHNQLPPIGPGSVLRDALETEALPVVILNEVMRQAGALKENSLEVLHGNIASTSTEDLDILKSGAGAGAWYLKDSLATPNDVLNYIRGLFEKEIIDTAFKYDPVKDTQILTARHDGPIGTRMLNEVMQFLVQRRRGNLIPDPAVAKEGKTKTKLHIGDKVIQTRNNYNTGLMNGTIGIVLKGFDDVDPTPPDELDELDSDSKPKLIVDFEGHIAKLNAEDARDLQLAYALTVHKSQGSEFPLVLVIAHKAHSFMQDRNWLYTAVTRAKKTCMLIGDHWGIRAAAKTIKAERRRTFLSLEGESWS